MVTQRDIFGQFVRSLPLNVETASLIAAEEGGHTPLDIIDWLQRGGSVTTDDHTYYMEPK